MADRTVSVNLVAKVQGFVSGMQTATKAAQDFTSKGLDKVGQNEQHIRTLTNTVGALGLALTGAAVLAVKSFADFDQQISNVAATGADAKSNLNSLRDAALEAGRVTAFSAKEAAVGVEELLKAGVSAKDVLGGGLSGALNLAAAGSLNVGDAAEIAATAMTQFKLGGDKVNHVADLLAAGAAKAQGGVSDLGMALKQSGLVAAQTGLSIEETTGGLTAFAAAGLLGSDAGTSFKSMLQRLTPQSKEAQKAMDELGITAYDSQGNFIGLANFAGVLQGALKDLTPEQRNSALATIFGSDAVRAASVIYDNGEQGIRDYIAAVDDQGFAAETAATRLDNLNGDLKILQGSFQTALIELGEGADGPLREMVQRITDVVNAFAELPDGVQGATLAIVGGAGLVLLGIAGMGKLLIAVNSIKAAMVELGITAKSAGLLVGGIGLAVAVATFGVAKWAEAQAKAKQRVDDITGALDQQTGALTDNVRATVYKNLVDDGVIDRAKNVGLSLKTVTDAALGGTDAISKLTDVQKGLQEQLQAARTEGTYYNQQWDGTKKQLADVGLVLEAVGVQTDAVTAGQERWRDQQDASVGTANAAADAQGELGDATADTNLDLGEQVDQLRNLIDAQAAAAGNVLNLRDAQRQFQDSIDSATTALETNGASLDINTKAGRENQAALDNIAKSGLGVVDSMKQNGATQEELTAQVQGTRDAFILAATQFGLTADEANALADELRLIPDVITPVVQLNVEPARVTLRNFLDGINNSSATIGLFARTGQPKAFAEGGYTGAGAKYQPAGVVHAGEFVTDQRATSMYRPILEAMNQHRYVPGFASGGFVGGGGNSAPAASFPSHITLVDADGSILAHTRVMVDASAASSARSARGAASAQGLSKIATGV